MDIADGVELGRLAAACLSEIASRSTRSSPKETTSWCACASTLEQNDDVQALWTVSAARMKAGREHRVPLSGRSHEVLIQASALAGDSALVFPGQDGTNPPSNMVF